MIECLTRKSMDPQKTDRMGRNALHIAAVCGRLDAYIFLVKCGCNPFQEDSLGQTPFLIATTSGSPELKSAARSNRGHRTRMGMGMGNRRRARTASLSKGSDESPPPSNLIGIDARSLACTGELETDLELGEIDLGVRPEVSDACKRKSLQDDPASITQYPNCAQNGVTLYATNSRGDLKPHAMRRLKQSRLSYAFFYASLVIGCWLLALAIPFYAWIVLVVLTFFILRLIHLTELYLACRRLLSCPTSLCPCSLTITVTRTAGPSLRQLMHRNQQLTRRWSAQEAV
jgi:Ankyrin repeats (many copies)